MKSQSQNPEFRINPENFHPWLRFLKIILKKNFFRNTIRVSNSFYSIQADYQQVTLAGNLLI